MLPLVSTSRTGPASYRGGDRRYWLLPFPCRRLYPRPGVRQIGIGQFSTYRIVICGDQYAPRHRDFNNAEDLLQRLRKAIPEIEWAAVPLNPLEKGTGSIVFNGELTRSSGQLMLFGFH